MLAYKKPLRQPARTLRKEMTDAERFLWSKLRKKQILGIQFYRQKPLANFIVDFYAPKAKLVIELDGSQHFTENGIFKDQRRDEHLNNLGLQVLRFDNLQILKEIDVVTQAILEKIQSTLGNTSL